MVNIIIIEKNGNIKQKKVNDFKQTDLYKHGGFKSAKDFEYQTSWKVELDKKYEIELYAKKNGRAGQENKYEFPPPVDEELYFGSCVLVNKKGDLTTSEWEDIYNYLYGGFEDLDDEDDDDESVEYEKTKHGYAKDDFIVDDDDEEDDIYCEEELEEEEYI